MIGLGIMSLAISVRAAPFKMSTGSASGLLRGESCPGEKVAQGRRKLLRAYVEFISDAQAFFGAKQVPGLKEGGVGEGRWRR
jgi:hypothetical protein